jgi:hypothetical protein
MWCAGVVAASLELVGSTPGRSVKQPEMVSLPYEYADRPGDSVEFVSSRHADQPVLSDEGIRPRLVKGEKRLVGNELAERLDMSKDGVRARPPLAGRTSVGVQQRSTATSVPLRGSERTSVDTPLPLRAVFAVVQDLVPLAHTGEVAGSNPAMPTQLRGPGP